MGKNTARAERRRKAKLRNQHLIYQYKRFKHCVDCGEDRVFLLEFDHKKDAATPAQKRSSFKKFSIGDSNVVGSEETRERDLIDEMKKCEIRCKNCHSLMERYKAGSYDGVVKEAFLDALEDYFEDIENVPEWYHGREET